MWDEIRDACNTPDSQDEGSFDHRRHFGACMPSGFSQLLNTQVTVIKSHFNNVSIEVTYCQIKKIYKPTTTKTWYLNRLFLEISRFAPKVSVPEKKKVGPAAALPVRCFNS